MSWPNCGWLDEATSRTSSLDGTKAQKLTFFNCGFHGQLGPVVRASGPFLFAQKLRQLGDIHSRCAAPHRAACSRIPARFQSARLAALGRGNLWPSSGNRIEQLQATVSDGGACNAISATIALKQ